MLRGLPFHLLLVVCALAALPGRALADTGAPEHGVMPPPSTCQASSLPPSLANARAALDQDPNDVDTRIAVAQALVDKGCYSDAVALLEAGAALRPRSSQLQSKLRAARSMLSEQKYFEGLGQAQENALQQRNLLRCQQLADLVACDDALRSKPDDLTLMLAKGDALLKSARPAEAVGISQRAVQLNPTAASAQSKLATAQAQRQAFVNRCQTTTGQSGVEACQAALLHGANDEFLVDARTGMLLQSLAKSEPALDSYIAAQTIKQDDRSVALAVVALTDSTGRQDALAVAARGSALSTLGRSAEAVKVLRSAQALSPSLPGIQAALASAERKAREEARRTPTLAVTGPVRAVPAPTPVGVATTPARVATASVRTYSNSADPGQAH